MAWLGYGVWSLVTAYLVQITLAAVLTYASLRHSIRPLFRHPDAAGILGFGTTVLATNILNWIMMGLDRLVIGATMPASTVGLYATMNNLVTTPVTTLVGAMQSALYATSARTQEDANHLRTALLSVLGAVGLLVAPVFFAIGMAAETIVLATYGAKWAGGGSILMPLAFAMPAFMLMGMAIPTLWASGRTNWEFRLQLPMAVVWAIALFAIVSRASIQTLSWCVCLWFHLRAAVILTAACRALDLTVRDVAAALAQGLLVTVIVAAAAYTIDRQGVAAGGSALLVLLAVIGTCAITLPLSLRLTRGLMAPAVYRLIEGFTRRLPHRVGALVRRHLIPRPS
jgi:PST family polysaccharide transporter